MEGGLLSWQGTHTVPETSKVSRQWEESVVLSTDDESPYGTDGFIEYPTGIQN